METYSCPGTRGIRIRAAASLYPMNRDVYDMATRQGCAGGRGAPLFDEAPDALVKPPHNGLRDELPVDVALEKTGLHGDCGVQRSPGRLLAVVVSTAEFGFPASGWRGGRMRRRIMLRQFPLGQVGMDRVYVRMPGTTR